MIVCAFTSRGVKFKTVFCAIRSLTSAFGAETKNKNKKLQGKGRLQFFQTNVF